MNMSHQFHTIGLIHSCFKEKFGIPRQAGLVPEAEGELEILPPYNRSEAFRRIEDYSHLWITFLFHASTREAWKPMVRPPRLGGNQRIGVFASRSPFRPNPIGLSVVKLLKLDLSDQQVILHLGGIDMLDGTPVLDIKPYIPYSDAIPEALAGFAALPPGREIDLSFTPEADEVLTGTDSDQGRHLKRLIRQILENDPRPAYLQEEQRNRFGMRLYDFNIHWEVSKGRYLITDIERLSETPFDR
ncbi:MAG: tRNA (N6-threonylcarbamoyladenosine(37)-N6)-methyltransferase TrmO [Candidatus Thiodiazotropha sp.]|jgi:tRNA (adenine37-N6)-methyltransferase